MLNEQPAGDAGGGWAPTAPHRDLFERAPIGLAWCSPDGHLRRANLRLAEMTGRAPEDLVARTWPALLLAQDRPLHAEALAELAACLDQRLTRTQRLEGPDGTVVPARVDLGAERDGSGRLTGVLISATPLGDEQGLRAQLAESEERFRLVVEATQDGLWDWDLETQTLWLSPSWKAQLGYTDAELANRFETWERLLHPDDHSRVMAHLEHYLARPGLVWHEQFRLRHRDRGWRQILARGIVVMGPGARPRRIFGIHVDVSELPGGADTLRLLNHGLEARLLERERALAESEQRFRGAFQAAAQGMALVAPDGGWLKVNAALCSMTGYSEQELLALDSQCLTHPDDLDGERELIARLLAGEVPSYQLEKRYLRRDGGLIWVLVTVSLVRDGAGRALHLVSQIQDITARKVAEQSLREAEARYRAIADHTHDWETWHDQEGRLRYCSPACERITGYPPAAFLQDPGLLASILHPDDREAHAARQRQALAGKATEALAFRIQSRERGVRWLEQTNRPMFTEDGAFAGSRGSLRDVTEAREAARELRRQKELAEALINTAQAIILVLDANARVVRANPYLCTLTGWPMNEVVGQDWIGRFLPAEVRAEIRAMFHLAFEGMRTQGNVNEILTRHGQRRSISWFDDVLPETDRFPRMVVAIGIDVTETLHAQRALEETNAFLDRRVRERTAELERAQAALVQSEKLSSLGTLVAGLSHEINNPLMGVMNYVQFARDHAPPEAAAALDKADRQLARIADMVANLLRYARPGAVHDRPSPRGDLAQAARQAADLLAAELRADDIALELDLPAGPLTGHIDPASAQQICLNLLINARDATRGAPRRVIRLRGGHGPGGVWLEVEDTGQGIPESVRRRVFDPFFTTKPVGQGIGLGLSVSLGLAQGAGGSLELCHTDTGGSCFRLSVPASGR
jgi:PAS domain S-box-containing protein